MRTGCAEKLWVKHHQIHPAHDLSRALVLPWTSAEPQNQPNCRTGITKPKSRIYFCSQQAPHQVNNLRTILWRTSDRPVLEAE